MAPSRRARRRPVEEGGGILAALAVNEAEPSSDVGAESKQQEDDAASAAAVSRPQQRRRRPQREDFSSSSSSSSEEEEEDSEEEEGSSEEEEEQEEDSDDDEESEVASTSSAAEEEEESDVDAVSFCGDERNAVLPGDDLEESAERDDADIDEDDVESEYDPEEELAQEEEDEDSELEADDADADEIRAARKNKHQSKPSGGGSSKTSTARISKPTGNVRAKAAEDATEMMDAKEASSIEKVEETAESDVDEEDEELEIDDMDDEDELRFARKINFKAESNHMTEKTEPLESKDSNNDVKISAKKVTVESEVDADDEDSDSDLEIDDVDDEDELRFARKSCFQSKSNQAATDDVEPLDFEDGVTTNGDGDDNDLTLDAVDHEAADLNSDTNGSEESFDRSAGGGSDARDLFPNTGGVVDANKEASTGAGASGSDALDLAPNTSGLVDTNNEASIGGGGGGGDAAMNLGPDFSDALTGHDDSRGLTTPPPTKTKDPPFLPPPVEQVTLVDNTSTNEGAAMSPLGTSICRDTQQPRSTSADPVVVAILIDDSDDDDDEYEEVVAEIIESEDEDDEATVSEPSPSHHSVPNQTSATRAAPELNVDNEEIPTQGPWMDEVYAEGGGSFGPYSNGDDVERSARPSPPPEPTDMSPVLREAPKSVVGDPTETLAAEDAEFVPKDPVSENESPVSQEEHLDSAGFREESSDISKSVPSDPMVGDPTETLAAEDADFVPKDPVSENHSPLSQEEPLESAGYREESSDILKSDHDPMVEDQAQSLAVEDSKFVPKDPVSENQLARGDDDDRLAESTSGLSVASEMVAGVETGMLSPGPPLKASAGSDDLEMADLVASIECCDLSPISKGASNHPCASEGTIANETVSATTNGGAVLQSLDSVSHGIPSADHLGVDSPVDIREAVGGKPDRGVETSDLETTTTTSTPAATAAEIVQNENCLDGEQPNIPTDTDLSVHSDAPVSTSVTNKDAPKPEVIESPLTTAPDPHPLETLTKLGVKSTEGCSPSTAGRSDEKSSKFFDSPGVVYIGRKESIQPLCCAAPPANGEATTTTAKADKAVHFQLPDTSSNSDTSTSDIDDKENSNGGLGKTIAPPSRVIDAESGVGNKLSGKRGKLRREGSVKIGKWKLGSKIGSGAFGVVHIGMNTETGTLMAVKSLRMEAAVMKDAKREVQLLKSLKHVNIVQYYGAEKDSRYLHIFQEWVPGGSITSLLSKFGPFPIAVLRGYLVQIITGLSYLHENNIMHRDIKGSNILVNDEGIVKLADFGAGKQLAHLQSDMMLSLTMRGTPYFMAPEVFEEKYSTKADIWSVGCVAFQMATGTPPWKSLGYTNPVSLFQHISKIDAPPTLEMNEAEAVSGVPDGRLKLELFKNVVSTCFRRLPEERPTAQELLRDALFSNDHSYTIEDEEDNSGLFSPLSTRSPGNPSSPLVVNLSPVRPRTRRRSNSFGATRSPFLSPPLPRSSDRRPARSFSSPQPDSSEWPTWARENFHADDDGPKQETPSNDDDNLMDSLAYSVEDGNGPSSTFGRPSLGSTLVGLTYVNSTMATNVAESGTDSLEHI